jgi:hypothetical protein
MLKTGKTAICQGFALRDRISYQNIVISEDLLFMFRKMQISKNINHFTNKQPSGLYLTVGAISCNLSKRVPFYAQPYVLSAFSKRW